MARKRDSWVILPSAIINAVAATLFGASGAVFVMLSAHAVSITSGHGTGQWLSAALVTIPASAVFGRRLLRDVRTKRLPLSAIPSL